MSEASGIRKTNVFISYSRRDSTFVEDLKISLETYGFEVSFDREDIAAGEAWAARLQALINEADTTICVVSRNWVASPECKKELNLARESGRRVIPVITEHIELELIPPELAKLQFVFFHGKDYTYARGVANLIADLKADHNWVREQSYLLKQAENWDATGRSDALRLRGEALEAALAWQNEDIPRDVKVLPVVTDFIAASEQGALTDKQKQLRNRIWQISLASLALVGILGTVATYAWGEMRVTKVNAERTLSEIEIDTWLQSLAAQNCASEASNLPNHEDPGDGAGAAPNSCTWANDGECDEPDLCAPGTDTNDCQRTSPVGGNGTNSCRFANDGECDEPDLCAPGTDTNDCRSSVANSCEYANDGECDEGVYCPMGTDTNDCAPMRMSGGDRCRWANDGECDEPDLCPPGTDTSDCAGASLPDPGQAAPVPERIMEADAVALVARLDAPDRLERMQAGQEVANALRDSQDPNILRALVEQLESPQAEQLSSPGRFNMLYMLNLSDGWGTAGIEEDMRRALTQMQSNSDIYIGNQTRDCINNLEQRLSGNTSVPRTCGGH